MVMLNLDDALMKAPLVKNTSRRCASAVVFSKVDCTAQSALCTGVNGYPHIKIHIKQDAAWSAREYALTAFPQYVFVTL